jgi:hypothetical protein
VPDIHGDPFDRMLVAQALAEKCALITGRRHPRPLWRARGLGMTRAPSRCSPSPHAANSSKRLTGAPARRRLTRINYISKAAAQSAGSKRLLYLAAQTATRLDGVAFDLFPAPRPRRLPARRRVPRCDAPTRWNYCSCLGCARLS